MIDTASPCKGQAWSWHSITLAMFYCSMQSGASLVHGEGQQTLPLIGSSVKDLTVTFVEVPTYLIAKCIQVLTKRLLK